jgi:arginine/lysine/ornithine decarboxylase
MVADVAGCAEVCHAAGVPLVVDQSWGPHFGFHPDLPPTATGLGADAVLTSTHKIGGSLTQSAMLHLVHEDRITEATLARTVRLVRSTSPSGLLNASLDAARRQLAVHGEAILHATLAAVRRTRERLDEVPGVRVVGEDLVGTPGVVAWDPMRIVMDIRGTGRTGYEVADALRQSYDVHPELATHATVVLVIGAGELPETLERVAGDIDEVCKRIARPGPPTEVVSSRGATLSSEMVVPPREAFLGQAEELAVEDAVGRISCESIAGYPPGIPTLLPGERLTAETVAYLQELVDGGGRLHGASDPTFRRISVLVESPPPA